jgi:hypothetical protein
MGRKPRVDRSPEEKWQIVQEGMKAGMSRKRVGVMASPEPNSHYAWNRSKHFDGQFASQFSSRVHLQRLCR